MKFDNKKTVKNHTFATHFGKSATDGIITDSGKF